MFHKKKFTLVDEKKEKKMYSAKNVKWLKYLIFFALAAFSLLLILANVKSKSYYQNLNATKNANKEKNSESRSILSLAESSSRAIGCTNDHCSITCSGDMTDLNTYLSNQKNCPSMKITITDCTFPNDRLQSNWLNGNFKLSCINITRATLTRIDSGAFNQNTMASLTELKLNEVQLASLTEDTFVGLNSLEIFTLVNEIEIFSGDGFLKPMAKTLKTLTIEHVTQTATDPGPWLRGNFPTLRYIYLDYSNFGGYIEAATFQHLSDLTILSMNSCKINYIADGAFDFMMAQIFVLIRLEKNQLKRLTGNYLTKMVTGLKNIFLINNPWDCTCELEDLIREYKRSPDAFGGNLKCSTPLEHAGKLLSEVTVDRCEDTTTTSSTTTPLSTSTTTSLSTTLSSSSSSTTEAITSTSPPSSITQDPTTSSSTTTSTSTLNPPSSTISSTESTAMTYSTEPPSIADESTESINTTPSTSTTDFTTITEAGITSPSPQTTPSPQNRTTTMSADEIISIECKRYTVDPSELINSPGPVVEVSRPDTHFYISPLSETSAQVVMEDPTTDLVLIWFYDQPIINGSGKNIRIIGEFKVGCQSDLEDSLHIEGLVRRRAYTFCLVKEGVQLVSPFNCLSHYTSEGKIVGIDEREVWLKYEDKALTIGLVVFGIIISLCIGAVSMFLVLRVQPALLKGSKRVILVNRNTGDVLIMPRPKGKSSMTESSYRDSFETNTTIRQRRFSETSIQSGRSYMMANNYEDIEYRWKMNTVNDMIYANRVPKSPPPPLPKRTTQGSSLTKKDVDEMKVSVVYQKGNDYGYIA